MTKKKPIIMTGVGFVQKIDPDTGKEIKDDADEKKSVKKSSDKKSKAPGAGGNE